MVKNFLIVGADSELAKAFIDLNKDKNIFKISRNIKASDIEITDYFNDIKKIVAFIHTIPNCYIIFFNGFIAENRPTQYPSFEEISLTYKINFQIPFFITQNLYNSENIKKFVYISSMAAVKPRLKNYIYGNAKNLLEQSIKTLSNKNSLFLRFGKIKTKMSSEHKDYFLTQEKEVAAKLILNNLNKTGIIYPNYGLLTLSLVLRLLPSRFINFVEKILN